MTGNSQIPKDILLNNLKELMPEIYSEGKIDWERLKATLGEDINFSNERYVLNWAGKSDAFRVLQAPSTRTLIPVKEESINFDETENIFIEGENLEVLKILQKSYFGRIKMIYIDPPYNTGSDSFIYPDKFSETKEEYQKRVGDKDEEGYMIREGMFRKNSKENGQYHSNWLNMMYPRLFLAKNLLLDDGVIFVSIDDNEVHNLRLLMNEIFGEENFVASIVWDGGRKNDSKKVSVGHEYIIIYCKNSDLELNDDTLWRERKEGIDKIYERYELLKKQYHDNYSLVSKGLQEWFNSLKDDDPSKKHCHYRYADEAGVYFPSDLSGPDDGRKNRPRYTVLHPLTGKPVTIPSRGWRWEESRMKEEISNNRVHFGENETTVPNGKVYLKENEFQAPSSVFYKDRRGASGLLKKLMGEKIFDFPKDTNVIKSLINLIVREGDIILDFFAGSCSTGEALLEYCKENKLNANFILVQLPELIDKESRAYSVGYKTIADIAKDRIKRVSNKINEDNQGKLDFNPDNKQDLGYKVFKLSDSNFKLWRQQGIETSEELEKQMELFTDPISQDALNDFMVYELLIKSGFDLNCRIKHENNIYFANSNEMVLLLESVSKDIISKVIKTNPQKVVALDKLFEGNDQLKTNTSLQMKDAGIDFKTI